MGSRGRRGSRESRPRPARRRVVTLVTLWVAVMVAVSVASGCYGHNCDGDVQNFGDDPGEEGRFVSPDLWESGPIDGMWLDFPKQRAWIFNVKGFGDRVPQVVIPYVSAQSDPNHEPGGNFTIAAGNLAEISGINKNTVVVHNGTCADYYLRVAIQGAPLGPAASESSSSTDADADTDAGDQDDDADAGP